MLTRKQLWRRVRRKVNIDINENIPKKKVEFYNIVKVTLIPSIKELNTQNLKHSIWWDDLDYIMFKREYMTEIENDKKYKSL